MSNPKGVTEAQRAVYKAAQKEYLQNRCLAVDTYMKLGFAGFNADRCITRFEERLEELGE